MKAKNLDQAEVARKSGLLPQEIYKYLRGKRSPGLKNICRIASALGISPALLLSHESIPVDYIPQEKLNSILIKVMGEMKKDQVLFKNLTVAKPENLQQMIENLGGWNNLYFLLKEEMHLQKMGEENFQKLRDDLLKKTLFA